MGPQIVKWSGILIMRLSPPRTRLFRTHGNARIPLGKRPPGSVLFQASGVSGVASGWAAPDLDARRRPPRALRVAADFSAMRRKCARLRCSARRRRSATGRIPSGSAWRSNDERNAPRAAEVIARGSLREWAMWAPRRPRWAWVTPGVWGGGLDPFKTRTSKVTRPFLGVIS